MKTIAKLSQRIAELEVKKETLLPELETLNSRYEGIKNRRTEEYMSEKTVNRGRAAILRTEIRSIEHEIKNLEWELDNKKENILYTIAWVSFGILGILGIVILTAYRYKLGLFGLTDTHDLVSIIHGENPVMDIELYKNLFWMNVAGVWTLVIGLVGSIVTSIKYALK